jgi:hypothetical protein
MIDEARSRELAEAEIKADGAFLGDARELREGWFFLTTTLLPVPRASSSTRRPGEHFTAARRSVQNATSRSMTAGSSSRNTTS